jgi:hypothetical protein
MKRRHIYKLTPEQEEKENYIRSVRKMTNLAKELRRPPEAHVTMAMGYSLVRPDDPDRGRAFLLPALSGDGQLPAAVLPALSAGAQQDY